MSYQSWLIVSLSWTLIFHVNHSKFTSFVSFFESKCLSMRFFFENLTKLSLSSLSSRSSFSKWWNACFETKVSCFFARSSYSMRLTTSCVLIRFFFFSIVLSLKRIFSKVLFWLKRFCCCFLNNLTNCWKFFKANRYLFRSRRKSLNSCKKSLRWCLIHHCNWRTISMFKECVTSLFSFDTTFDVKKNWRNL